MVTSALDISHILELLMTKSGLNESELARKTSIPRATINRLASGRTPDPRASTLMAIASYFSISVDQLLGKQPLFKSTGEHHEMILNASIPVLRWEQLGDWELVILNSEQQNLDYTSVDHLSMQGRFALRVRGEAMWPQFQEDSFLIIDPERNPLNRDFVIVYIKETKDFLFRQLFTESNYRLLKPVNNLFPVIKMQENDDQIIGVVIQTKKSY